MCLCAGEREKEGGREGQREWLGHSNLVNLVSCLKAASLKHSESLSLHSLTQNHLPGLLFGCC